MESFVLIQSNIGKEKKHYIMFDVKEKGRQLIQELIWISQH